MDLESQLQRLTRIESRTLIALALARGLRPVRIIPRRRSNGTGYKRLRPTFYFAPSELLSEILATDEAQIELLRRYADALVEYREMYDRCKAAASWR